MNQIVRVPLHPTFNVATCSHGSVPGLRKKQRFLFSLASLLGANIEEGGEGGKTGNTMVHSTETKLRVPLRVGTLFFSQTPEQDFICFIIQDSQVHHDHSFGYHLFPKNPLRVEWIHKVFVDCVPNLVVAWAPGLVVYVSCPAGICMSGGLCVVRFRSW